MAYLHKFETQSQFESYYYGENYEEPFVGFVAETSGVSYNKGSVPPPPVDYRSMPLTIEITNGSGDITFNRQQLNYKVNDGEWTLDDNPTIPVSRGDTIQVKQDYQAPSGSGSGSGSGPGSDPQLFSADDSLQYNVYGNIMSIYQEDGFENLTSFSGEEEAVFAMLFMYCNIISAENLVLPVLTLTPECYKYMFNGCTSLAQAPDLPATTLAYSCYDNMFMGCTSLTTAPELPATTLANRCYYNMFRGCSSLTTAPVLPATTLADGCYYEMFEYCSGLTIAPVLPATTLANECYRYMFGFCYSLTTPPVLPATTLAQYCYASMFHSCKSLTTAPELPATTLTKNCYEGMLYDTNVLPDCSNIDFSSQSVVQSGGLQGLFEGTKVTDADLFNILPINPQTGKYYLPVTTLATLCYKGMFSRCASLTTAPELPATTLASSCYWHMFYECKSLTTAPALPATTLANSCYSRMFEGCTSLTTAPSILPATAATDSCYSDMFSRCASLTTAPELPATTLANYCYSRMFEGCRSLVTAPSTLPATATKLNCYNGMFSGCTHLEMSPEIKATNLTEGSCSNMFNGCTSLNYIKCLATSLSPYSPTASWVRGVASTGTFVKNPNMSSWTTGVNGIPTGWTVQDAS